MSLKHATDSKFFLPQIVELCLVCYGFFFIYDPQFLNGMELENMLLFVIKQGSFLFIEAFHFIIKLNHSLFLHL